MWWMVWQEKVTQIVMLINLEERDKKKCFKYWPEEGHTVKYGHVEVTCHGEHVRADFLVRTFSVKGGRNASGRTVQQYHYLSWPDHEVPTAGTLVDFWRYVTARASATAPTVVHCSAGAGRTGTYIALDIALNQKSRGVDVSLETIVSELREQRSIMVQTEAQYKFLHEVVLEAYSSRNTRLSLHHLDLNFSGDINVWKSQSTKDREYKMLQQMQAWAKRNTATAQAAENRNKNRDPLHLPDDNQLVYLTDYAKGRNQYINAVSKSILTKRGLLLTQLPLPDTVVDLWRLVGSYEVHTIVSLASPDEDKTVQYWPVKKGKSLTAGEYSVSLGDTASMGSCLTSYSVTVQSKGHSRVVHVLHYTDWSGEEPGAISAIIQLVNLVSNATDPAPVLVQCLNGATKSGLFCVLHDVTTRITADEEIDVFSAVRSVLQIRPQAISEAQYHYCYKVAQQYKQSLRVYGNV